MIGFRLMLLSLAALPALLLPAPASDPDATPEVRRLIEQLGDDDFDQREAATTRLKEIGEPALDALHQTVTSNDVEVRSRARDIVAFLEKKLSAEQLRFTGHNGAVWCVCVSADGKRVLTSSDDKTLRLWNADTGQELRVLEGHTECVYGAAISQDSRHVLSGSRDKTVRLWDATTGKELRRMIGHSSEVSNVAFGPEGQALSGGSDRSMYSMYLWDLKTGKKVGVFSGHAGHVRYVAYSDRAKLAATCGADHSIRLWNLDTGTFRTLTGASFYNEISVCFSLDGKRLVSAGYDHVLRIWDVETGKELKQIKDVWINCAEFSADGQRIVTGGDYDDNTVRVWDAVTGKVLRKYEGHTAGVLSVTFFPDGKRIASASADGTARTWRAPR